MLLQLSIKYVLMLLWSPTWGAVLAWLVITPDEQVAPCMILTLFAFCVCESANAGVLSLGQYHKESSTEMHALFTSLVFLPMRNNRQSPLWDILNFFQCSTSEIIVVTSSCGLRSKLDIKEPTKPSAEVSRWNLWEQYPWHGSACPEKWVTGDNRGKEKEEDVQLF